MMHAGCVIGMDGDHVMEELSYIAFAFMIVHIIRCFLGSRSAQREAFEVAQRMACDGYNHTFTTLAVLCANGMLRTRVRSDCVDCP